MHRKPIVSPSTVLESASAIGLPPADEAAAARIAAGAGAAVAAVREVLVRIDDADALFDLEPAGYLALLEALADPPTGDPSSAGTG